VVSDRKGGQHGRRNGLYIVSDREQPEDHPHFRGRTHLLQIELRECDLPVKERHITRDVDHGSKLFPWRHGSRRRVNFSVYSKNASHVDVLLFDTVDAAKPARVVSLDRQQHRTYHYWHAWVRGIRPGQIYGYRVHGPFARPKV